ncbi:GDP-mannose 4,6-dehydratase [Luminiphilus syltensis]|uniref:GDP-mannose 4,6-dehydratase n=1 Tax=Luminiphilus syltensis TaxID=1341119 RepID=UPI0026CC5836
MKSALIFGVTGQDGSLLATLLLKRGYHVFGVTRRPSSEIQCNLNKLNIRDRIKILVADVVDFQSVLEIVGSINPNEIYMLSGQSSVGTSFSSPRETIESFSNATLNVLEACRLSYSSSRVYIAGSSECFGNTPIKGATEITAFNPLSPYAVGKVSSYYLARN